MPGMLSGVSPGLPPTDASAIFRYIATKDHTTNSVISFTFTVTPGTSTLTTSSAHGLTGWGTFSIPAMVFNVSSTGTLPSPLVAGTQYAWNVVSTTQLYLFPLNSPGYPFDGIMDNAAYGINPIVFTDAGTGTHTLFSDLVVSAIKDITGNGYDAVQPATGGLPIKTKYGQTGVYLPGWLAYNLRDGSAIKSFTSASVTIGTGTGAGNIAIAGHGYTTGKGVYLDGDKQGYPFVAGQLPKNALPKTQYFINVVDANNITLYDTYAHAIAGGGVGNGLITFADAGQSGNMYVGYAFIGASDKFAAAATGATWLNGKTGCTIICVSRFEWQNNWDSNSRSFPSTFKNEAGQAYVSPVYWPWRGEMPIINIDASNGSIINTSTGLFTVPNHGLTRGDAVRLSTNGTLPTGFQVSDLPYVDMSTTANVDLVNNTLNVPGHGKATGTPVWLSPYGGKLPATFSVANSSVYYIRAIDANTIAFYSSAANASSDTSRLPIPSVKTVSSVNTSTGLITLTATHGASTPNPVYLTTTGTLPTGLALNTKYYVKNVSSTTINLYATADNATNNVSPIIPSDAGTGTHSINIMADGYVQISQLYFVRTLTQNTFNLQTTYFNAISGSSDTAGVVIPSALGSGTMTLTTASGHSSMNTFDATGSVVSFSTGLWTFSNHGYNWGQGIQFKGLDGTCSVGISEGTTYYVRPANNNSFYLYDTYAHCMAADTTPGVAPTTGLIIPSAAGTAKNMRTQDVVPGWQAAHTILAPIGGAGTEFTVGTMHRFTTFDWMLQIWTVDLTTVPNMQANFYVGKSGAYPCISSGANFFPTGLTCTKGTGVFTNVTHQNHALWDSGNADLPFKGQQLELVTIPRCLTPTEIQQVQAMYHSFYPFLNPNIT